MRDDPWLSHIPAKYKIGRVISGEVSQIKKFGVIVALEPGITGQVHISEISDRRVDRIEDAVKLGQIIRVRILRVDTEERKIGLSRKRARGM